MQIKDAALLRHEGFIGGTWCAADSGRKVDILNPANGQNLGSVPVMGADETRRAIEAARAAMRFGIQPPNQLVTVQDG